MPRGSALLELVRDSDWRISTGFVGTPLICDALEITGHIDDAHRLLFQSELPSWLYPVRMGATTIWERWDSMLPDGTINPGEMTSFNHYALGAIADWMHRSVAGLAPAAPGYREISVRPRPPAQLDFAEARHDTPYGEAVVRWDRTANGIELSVTVPVGTTAVIEPPGTDEIHRVQAGIHRFISPPRRTADDPQRTSGRLVVDRRVTRLPVAEPHDAPGEVLSARLGTARGTS